MLSYGWGYAAIALKKPLGGGWGDSDTLVFLPEKEKFVAKFSQWSRGIIIINTHDRPLSWQAKKNYMGGNCPPPPPPPIWCHPCSYTIHSIKLEEKKFTIYILPLELMSEDYQASFIAGGLVKFTIQSLHNCLLFYSEFIFTCSFPCHCNALYKLNIKQNSKFKIGSIFPWEHNMGFSLLHP